MDINILEMVARGAILFPPFLLALCVHEYAHGWAAKKFGDTTAEDMGRLTLNPIAHADILGTVVLPLFGLMGGGVLFGWAKPVPVDTRNLKNPRKEMFWIAFAGPLSNLIMAVFGALAFVLSTKYLHVSFSGAVFSMLQFFVIINCVLFVFNMIPVHPLDGGKILERFIPYKWNQLLEQYQRQLFIGLMIFLFMGGFTYLAKPIYGINDLLLNFFSAIV